MTNTKPTGTFRCRACGQRWPGAEVMHDVYRPGRYVCGDPFCGGVVDRVKEVDAAAASVATEERTQ